MSVIIKLACARFILCNSDREKHDLPKAQAHKPAAVQKKQLVAAAAAATRGWLPTLPGARECTLYAAVYLPIDPGGWRT